MNIHFDFGNIRATEFGIGRYENGEDTLNLIPVDRSVQAALKEMAEATWMRMTDMTEEPTIYEPSEKYSSEEYLYLPLNDELATRLREIHLAQNIPLNGRAILDTSGMYCYFSRFTDNTGRHLTAIRRSTQFKGVLKKRLIQFVDDTLKVIRDYVFRLDNDFDLLIDDDNVFIFRPKGFESIGQLKEALLAAVPQNIQRIQQEMDFVDFSSIQEYAVNHPRAASYLASIRSQGEMNNIDRERLKALCERTGVEIEEDNGILIVDEKNIMGFLEVLDRRRYEVELVPQSPESYKASSRSRLSNGGNS